MRALPLLVLVACKGSSAPAPTVRVPDASPQPVPVPVPDAGPALDAAATPHGTLPLTITTIHAHEQPTDAAPFHGPGGEWTYLDLETPEHHTFTVGFHDAGELETHVRTRLLDVRVIELDRTQGGAVVEELERALGVRVDSAAVLAKPLTPLTLAATIDDDTGGWTRTTWIFPGPSNTTLHFDWSLFSLQAALREADPRSDGYALAALGTALRDGLGAP
jgi:hypothetical protein